MLISGKADIIRIAYSSTTHLPLNIGSVEERENVFISTQSATVNGIINNNVKIENTIFSGSPISYTGSPNAYVEMSGDGTLELIGCEFHESDTEAILVDCPIEVENCLFRDNTVCLHSTDGDISIGASTFKGSDIGIKVSLANQATGNIIIGGSTFENEIDYFSTGASSLAHISGNSFNGDLYSILADGENNYIVEGNNIDGSGIGGVSFSNGSYPNLFRRNSISNNTIGSIAEEDNSNLLYLENCYQSISEDMNLDGSMNIPHGTVSIGAGNRFTETLVQNVVASSSINFPYHYPISGSNYDPTLKPKGYQHVENSTSVDAENCGSHLDVAPYFCVEVETLRCYEIPSYIQQLINLILQVQNNNSLSPDQIFILTAQYNECLRIIRLHRMKNCGEIWPPISNPWWHEGRRMTTSISNLIDLEAFDLANMFMETLEAGETDEETQDFIVTQRINIERLTSESNYEISIEDESALFTIAQKSYPLSAYARGLYTILTGEVIVPEITPFLQLELRNSVESQTINLKVNPNPANNYLHISVSYSNKRKIMYRITNSLGQFVLADSKVDSEFDLDVSHLDSGIYFLEAYSNGKKIEDTQKLVIRN